MDINIGGALRGAAPTYFYKLQDRSGQVKGE